jgi:AcrR family transcriptional regulator
MGIEDRRERERAARRQLITATARTLAETEGWDAVTTRRLSSEIEYSQPVLYRHFGSMEEIVEAVAVEGFGELAEMLRAARRSCDKSADRVAVAAAAYCEFARKNPALYDAMFNRATRLAFGADGRPAQLSEGFSELRDAAATIGGVGDLDTLTEVLWSALHGLVMLSRTARLRPDHDAERIEVLVAHFRNGAP